ncbi:hypothetical protein C8Q80DRAFT_1139660 [Daedaleopsis nitida]|nr:hypothetical protein C8Q80DRAFT_1139660 [Daedaleopsis nitida]
MLTILWLVGLVTPAMTYLGLISQPLAGTRPPRCYKCSLLPVYQCSWVICLGWAQAGLTLDTSDPSKSHPVNAGCMHGTLYIGLLCS